LKTTILAGALALAGLSMAPVSATAASFGAQADVGALAPTEVEQAQYYYRRRYYRPRYRYYRRAYRPRYYGYRPYYRPRPRYYRY
jgi:hypothetical protein